MSGVSSKRGKSKGTGPSKRHKATSSSSEPRIFLTRKECEELGQPLPPCNYGVDLHSTTPSLSFSGDALERYNSISSLKVLPFRYFDEHVMEKLGIRDEIEKILTTSGWPSWLDMDEPTCPDLVYEFFATVKCDVEVVNTLSLTSRLTFRMMGLWFSVRLEEICDWFGWQYNAGIKTNPPRFQYSFWPTISSDPQWPSGRIKSTKITDPSLSYIHRVMVHSLFGNEGSNSSVSLGELGVLYWLHREMYVDWGFVFSTRLLELARRKGKGSLIFGGFITRIATKLGIISRDSSHISWMEGGQPVATIDFTVLKNMGVISGTFDDFRWTGYKSSSSSTILAEEEPILEHVPHSDDRHTSPSHSHADEFSEPQRAYLQRMEQSIKDHIDLRFSEHRGWMEQFCASLTAQCQTSSRDPSLDPPPDA